PELPEGGSATLSAVSAVPSEGVLVPARGGSMTTFGLIQNRERDRPCVFSVASRSQSWSISSSTASSASSRVESLDQPARYTSLGPKPWGGAPATILAASACAAPTAERTVGEKMRRAWVSRYLPQAIARSSASTVTAPLWPSARWNSRARAGVRR